MKKVISLVLSVIMIFAAFPFVAGANELEAVIYTIKGDFRENGKYLDISIEMDNCKTPLWDFLFYFSYNTDILTLVENSFANGNLWDYRVADIDIYVNGSLHKYPWARNTIQFAFSGKSIENPITVESGTVVSFSFEVAENVIEDEKFNPDIFEFVLNTWYEGEKWESNPEHHGYVSDPNLGVIQPVPFTYIVDIDKHYNSQIIPKVEPTCTEVGYTEGKKCIDCDLVTEVPQEIPMLGHTFGYSELIREYTESEPGVILSQCSVCSAFEEIEFYVCFLAGVDMNWFCAGDVVEVYIPRVIFDYEADERYIYLGCFADGLELSTEDTQFTFEMPENHVYLWPAIIHHGDVNLDDKVTASDLLYLLQGIKNGVEGVQFDVNVDGKISAADKLALQQIIKGTFDHSTLPH